MDEEITYGALIRHYRQELREAGKADSTISNQVSRLKRFMALAGRDDHDPAGTELEDDQTFIQIRDQVIEEGAASNQRAMRSTLQAWRKSYRRLVRQIELPDRFCDALRVLMNRSGLSQASVAKSIGVSRKGLGNWIEGVCVPRRSEKSLQRIAAAEDFFGLDRGCLEKKLGYRSLRQKPAQPYTRLCKQPYALKDEDIPSQLKAEIRSLVRFKTDAITGNQNRHSTWRLRNEEDYGRRVSSLARIGSQVCPTAHIVIRRVRSFCGFLVKEKGWALEDLRLVHCTDPELLEEYIRFLKDRRGHYTSTATSLLKDMAPLVHPEWGHITQSPDMGDHIHSPVSRAEWRSFCADRYDQIICMRKQLETSGQVRRGRKAEDPIERILDHPEPASWLFTMADRMEREFYLNASENRPYATAALARNIALVKLLIMNPLRVNHLTTMTYQADNTGNLRRKQDGSWQLLYEPWEFKNERGAAKETYRAEIHPWASEALERYLFSYRPKLPGADTTDYVFLSQNSGGESGLRKQSLFNIGRVITNTTRTFLPEVAPNGFGPHAFRHIIATHYLKRHPGNYPLVAQILHDRLSTVMQAYGHLQVGDGLDAWAETVQAHIKNGGEHDRTSL